MPAPSKFDPRRRERIITLLAAGASRREAARGAAVSAATLTRWIQRGARSSPEGRWRQFHDEVVRAETGAHELTSLTVFEQWEANPDLAMKYLLENGF